MQIKFTLRFFDYAYFNFVHSFKLLVLQGFFVILSASISLDMLSISGSVGGIAIVTTLAIACLVYLALWLAQLILGVILLLGENKTLLTACTIEVLDDALLEETKFNKNFAYWSGIVKVVSCPGFIAIYVTQHNAYIIPNRAFASPVQKADFLKQVREKVRAARES
ncbi:MAG: YcxB family protein [Zoogloeaceae bacterium]|nr:YcxB family protein [Zoogloeaceae bacterium]